jgi:hypothetical protein
MAAIVCLCEIITQGHLKEGILINWATAQTQGFHKHEGKVAGTIRPAPRSRKGMCLITERDHQGLRESFGFRIRDP